jgi:redox-sensing transcriptional repressor
VGGTNPSLLRAIGAGATVVAYDVDFNREVVADAGRYFATPADVAQQVCDRLVAAGVRSTLNFAPTTLAAPDGVDVRPVDLSVELQVLAFLGQQRAVPAEEVTA